MIRYTELTGAMRFWDDDLAPYGSRYDASLHIHWESPKTVNLTMFTLNAGGHVTRKLLRELVEKMVELGVERMRSTREHGRLLPLAHLQSDGTFINEVSELVEFCAREERRRPPPGRRPPAQPEGQQRRLGERDWQPDPPEIQRVPPEPPPEDPPV